MPPGLTVSVAPGKGGTGKTAVAVNSALALAGSRRVKFLDFDVEVLESVAQGVPLAEYSPGAAAEHVRCTWDDLREDLT
jgi:MinD superfamily P-loop ATPase